MMPKQFEFHLERFSRFVFFEVCGKTVESLNCPVLKLPILKETWIVLSYERLTKVRLVEYTLNWKMTL